ncbi:Repeat-containing protein [Diplonema papillatum]|nr:Repeat-containing protein [Diplonema papillatum]
MAIKNRQNSCSAADSMLSTQPFPIEILTRIIQYIPAAEAHFVVSRACKGWRAAFEEYCASLPGLALLLGCQCGPPPAGVRYLTDLGTSSSLLCKYIEACVKPYLAPPDLDSQQAFAVHYHDQRAVEALYLDPNEELLFTGCRDGYLTVRDLRDTSVFGRRNLSSSLESKEEGPQSKRQITSLSFHRDSIWCLDFWAEERLLVAGAADCSVSLWKMGRLEAGQQVTGNRVGTLEKHTDSVFVTRINSSTEVLVTGGWDTALNVFRYNHQTRMFDHMYCSGALHTDGIWRGAFQSPLGERFFTGSWDGKSTLFDLTNATTVTTCDLLSFVTDLKLFDYHSVWLSTDTNEVHLWDTRQVQPAISFRTREVSRINCTQFVLFVASDGVYTYDIRFPAYPAKVGCWLPSKEMDHSIVSCEFPSANRFPEAYQHNVLGIGRFDGTVTVLNTKGFV